VVVICQPGPASVATTTPNVQTSIDIVHQDPRRAGSTAGVQAPLRRDARACMTVSKAVEPALTRSLRSSPGPAACPGRCGRGRAGCLGCDSGLPCPAAGRPCPPRGAAAPQRDRPDCAGVGTRGGGQHEVLLDGDLVVNVPAEACREPEAAHTSLLVRGACVGCYHTCVSSLPHIQRLHGEQMDRIL